MSAYGFDEDKNKVDVAPTDRVDISCSNDNLEKNIFYQQMNLFNSTYMIINKLRTGTTVTDADMTNFRNLATTISGNVRDINADY